ncbi:hypothetical protein [Paraburkholderia phenoliruptrix]|uniref:hypothetical protein n=1 Tax=Paraburkholderia phenoliruptrix TaxID=252970 RepID=UPI0034CF8ADE
MLTAPGAKQFDVHVDGVGAFTFARRNMRAEIAIAAEYSRLTEGVSQPSAFLDTIAGWLSTLKVLTVKAPAGWDLDEMDPLDDEAYAILLKVHAALREKEGSFRRRTGGEGQAQRPRDGGNGGVLVPPEVQPGAD